MIKAPSWPTIMVCLALTISSQTSASSAQNCEGIKILDSEAEFEKINSYLLNYNCAIFPKLPNEIPPGLSTFWAQELSGTDLLNEELQSKKLSLENAPNLVHVLDVPNQDSHGQQTSQLIVSKENSSVFFGEYREFTKVNNADDFKNYASTCVQNRNCPTYLNLSVGDGPGSFSYASYLLKTGSLIIQAAGNESIGVQDQKLNPCKEPNVLCVGSMSYDGLPSNFSNSGSDVHISALSNLELASFDKAGNLKPFGGTSGAAPQVTGVLAAFTMITGYKLSKDEAIKLLKMTSMPNVSSITGNTEFGSGSLNSYRVGQVAFKAADTCKGSQKAECIKKLLQTEDAYVIKPFKIKSSKEVFPFCTAGTEDSNSRPVSCERKKELALKIRKNFLLDPRNQENSKLLECIYKLEGYPLNAALISNITKQKGSKEFEEYLNDLVEQGNHDQELVYLLNDPAWAHRKDWINKIFSRGQSDTQIFRYLLRKPAWHHKKDWVIKQFKKRPVSMELDALLEEPFWKDQQDLKDLLKEVQESGPREI